MTFSDSDLFFCFYLQIGSHFAREEDPVPYMVSQPLPWQVHSVSHSRRSSKAEEVCPNQTLYKARQVCADQQWQHSRTPSSYLDVEVLHYMEPMTNSDFFWPRPENFPHKFILQSSVISACHKNGHDLLSV